jgi:hypothetical protein
MDTEVTKLTQALKGIFKVLEELYGRDDKSDGPDSGRSLGNHVASTEKPEHGLTPTIVQQPVHQLPVDIGVTGIQQLAAHASSPVNDGANKLSGSFDTLPLIGTQEGLQMPMQSEGVLHPQVVTPEDTPLTDKERIQQLEQELRSMQRQSNVNFNFAPVTIGGTNGQSSN